MQNLALGLIKLSFVVFYRRIFDVNEARPIGSVWFLSLLLP